MRRSRQCTEPTHRPCTLSGAPLFIAHRTALLKLASKARLPVIYWAREFADAGGLMSYGANFGELVPPIGRVRRQDPEGRQAGICRSSNRPSSSSWSISRRPRRSG